MSIANWDAKKDHCKITMNIFLPRAEVHKEYHRRPWSVVQPELRNISPENKLICKAQVDHILGPLLVQWLSEIKSSTSPLCSADLWSRKVACIIVETVGAI